MAEAAKGMKGSEEDPARALRDLRARHDALVRSVRGLSWERVLPAAALMLVALVLPWGMLEADDRDDGDVRLTLLGLLRRSGDLSSTSALATVAGVAFVAALLALLLTVAGAYARRSALAVAATVASAIGLFFALGLAYGVPRLGAPDSRGSLPEGEMSLETSGWLLGLVAFAWLIAANVRAAKGDDPEDW